MSPDPSKRYSMRILDADMKQQLRDLFDGLETKLGIQGMSVALYSVIMELVGNAVKANLKRAFFREHRYSMDDPDTYQAGLAAFKQSHGTLKKEDYVGALEDLDLVVSVEVDLDHQRLLAYVENTTILIAEEERRIRKKLGNAMDCSELTDFYMNYGDDIEGSGLGLAMIVFMIREIGFDPKYFRVFHRGNRTIARLEFPLEADYVPIRERGPVEGNLGPV